MTPKEKAIQIIDKFTYWNTRQAEREGIESALRAVDEILEFMSKADFLNDWWINYYKEVKQEIQKHND